MNGLSITHKRLLCRAFLALANGRKIIEVRDDDAPAASELEAVGYLKPDENGVTLTRPIGYIVARRVSADPAALPTLSDDAWYILGLGHAALERACLPPSLHETGIVAPWFSVPARLAAVASELEREGYLEVGVHPMLTAYCLSNAGIILANTKAAQAVVGG